MDATTINLIQRFYPVDLSNIRYAVGINTVHGNPITIGNEVFFPYDNIDLSDDADSATMYHELQHVVQYSRRGGVEPFLTEYVLKAAGQIWSKRSIDIHDDIDLEREAILKSTEVANGVAYGWNILITNRCAYPISMAVLYRDLKGAWIATGYWTYAPGNSSYLADSNNDKIHSKNRIFYVYAKIQNADYSWTGDLNYTIRDDNRTVKFRKIEETAGSIQELSYEFDCNNYNP